MKIKVEVDKSIVEDEIVIKCKELNSNIYDIQKLLSDKINKRTQMMFRKGSVEYYIELEGILFFETYDSIINAHTVDEVYEVDYKLYELEEMLPIYFIRVSKSTILNVMNVISINRNINSSSIVEFKNTYKTTFVSRHYYKDFKIRLEEVRI
ncbi:MAG: LytTR family transcriptional regulator [Tissierellia bacterium]|nr:LytTR family transcriptional regulator [Tissierellia bacterium]